MSRNWNSCLQRKSPPGKVKLCPSTQTEFVICDCTIEAYIDEQKTHLRLSGQPLRSKEPGLVRQELYGLLLAHYIVRWWMHQSACEADLDPDRLSFTHAVGVLDTACYEFSLVARHELPQLKERLLADLRDPSTLLPPRRLRF